MYGYYYCRQKIWPNFIIMTMLPGIFFLWSMTRTVLFLPFLPLCSMKTNICSTYRVLDYLYITLYVFMIHFCLQYFHLCVYHKMPIFQHEKYLPTEVTISMANERLGAQTEVVFHIEEGSFYNCVMPGIQYQPTK